MEPKRIVKSGPKNDDGIAITYVRRRGVLVLSGWYKGVREIEPKEIPIRQFVRQLGITEADFAKLLKEG